MEDAPVTLLARAREAGLAVALDAAGELVLRGPKRLAALAAQVLENADAVRDVLSAAHVETAVAITAALRGLGWTVVYSNVVGAELIFIRDQAVTVPPELAGVPCFDRDELALLAAERPSADRLRAIVDVKREMGGRAVQDTGERLTPARQVFPITANAEDATTATEAAQGELEAPAGRDWRPK